MEWLRSVSDVIEEFFSHVIYSEFFLSFQESPRLLEVFYCEVS